MQATSLGERTRMTCNNIAAAVMFTAMTRSKHLVAALMVGTLLIAAPDLAFAQAAPWETTAQNTYNLIMSIVRWVAIIGVVACGAAAIFGKLSWDWAGKIIIGLVLIFGGTQLVDYFRDGMGG